MMCQMIGMPPISIIGFGLTSVSSENRVPSPPARRTAFIGFHPRRSLLRGHPFLSHDDPYARQTLQGVPMRQEGNQAKSCGRPVSPQSAVCRGLFAVAPRSSRTGARDVPKPIRPWCSTPQV